MASKAPLLCSRRAVLTGIAGTLGLGAVSVARSAEPQLAADEGIVLCGFTSAFATRVQFRQLHSSILFTARPQTATEASTPAVVKTGFYYYYDFDTSYSITHAPFPEPANNHGAFQIPSGAVTYVGDWLVSLGSVKVAVRLDTIARARKDNPWLEHYPLYVSLVGRDVVRLPWEQVPQA